MLERLLALLGITVQKEENLQEEGLESYEDVDRIPQSPCQASCIGVL